MAQVKQIVMATMLMLSIVVVSYGGTITGSRTTTSGARVGTITGSRTGTITGSRTGTITGSRVGTITGSKLGRTPNFQEEVFSGILIVLINFAW